MSVIAGSSRTPSPIHQVGRTAGRRVAVGARVSWLVALLALAAALVGLLVEDVYGDPAATAEMLRAYDLVTAVVVVPALVVAAYLGRRGSAMAQVVVVSLEAALVYTYAYYVFGTTFNDVFLLHLVVFGASLVALGLSLATLDVPGVARRLDSGTRVRVPATLLGLLAVALGAMWVYVAVDNAATGVVPDGSRLVETDLVVRLGIALDVTFLVPLYAVAAVLLWRREPWGYVLAAVALIAGVVHQVAYVVAMPFQVAADVPGAVSQDPGEPFVVLVYVVAAAVLLQPVVRSGATSTRHGTSGRLR